MIAAAPNKHGLTAGWKELRFHPTQRAAWETSARYVALPCGRGSGKTELARRRIVYYLSVAKPWPDPIYAFVLPTFKQAKRVAWKPLLQLIPREWIVKKNETDLTIETVFGSTLIVAGADQPQRLEGVQYDGVIIDESSDQKPGVFNKTFYPAFAHRGAWCWRIGVPKRQGIGAAEYREFCESAANVGGKDATVATYNWPSADIMPPDEVADAQRRLDPRDYAEQYLAKWQSASGAVFYSFNEELNVADYIYSPNHAIIVGCDFNVDPMAWVLCQKVYWPDYGCEGLNVFDEMFVRNTNTQQTLDLLWHKYGSHAAQWVFIGDATARARKTSASMSDYYQIVNDTRFKNAQVWFPRSNPAVADRFSATNALLCNAAGQRRLIINPRCRHTIADLNGRAYKPGTREPNDLGDIGHITDALGYVVWNQYPPVIDRRPEQPAEIITTRW